MQSLSLLRPHTPIAISVESNLQRCCQSCLRYRIRIYVVIGQIVFLVRQWCHARGCPTAHRPYEDQGIRNSRIRCVKRCWAYQTHRRRGQCSNFETILQKCVRRSRQNHDTVRTIDSVDRDKCREVQALGVHQSVRMALLCIDNQRNICKHDAGLHS